MSWNTAGSGTTSAELIKSAELAVRTVLPAGWDVALATAGTTAGSKFAPTDAVLTIKAPGGPRATVLVEFRGAVVPRDVASIAARLAAGRGSTGNSAMLVTPFVSPTTRSCLSEHGLGWFDATGNLRLALDRPAVFVDRVGADRSPSREPAEHVLKSLRGPAAARVVLELLETDRPVKVRELAGRAGVSAATSARVLDLLDREAVIRRSGNGTVTAVNKRSLVTRWTQDYKLTKSNEVMTTLDPRGIEHALRTLPSVARNIVVTGSAAARAYLPDELAPVAPLVSLSLYTDDPMTLMTELGLKKVERGMNVLLIRPYDQVVATRSRTLGGVPYAAPGQVLADLLTGPGRSTEEAEQLMVALVSTETGWAS